MSSLAELQNGERYLSQSKAWERSRPRSRNTSGTSKRKDLTYGVDQRLGSIGLSQFLL